MTRGVETRTFKVVEDAEAKFATLSGPIDVGDPERSTFARADDLRVVGARGTAQAKVSGEHGSPRKVWLTRADGATFPVEAEVLRALRQPESLLRDGRLARVELARVTGVRWSSGEHTLTLERLAPGQWGPKGEDGELPTAQGVLAYAMRVEALHMERGARAPEGAASLTWTHGSGEETVVLWEDGEGWLARSGHTKEAVRLSPGAGGAIADLNRLAEQARRGVLMRVRPVDAEHGIGP